MNMTADTDDTSKFFAEWSELAKSDPKRFEEERQKTLAGFLESVPERHKDRLARLQWRIDQERARCKNPTAAMLRLNQMMMDRLCNEGGLQDALLAGSYIIKQELIPVLHPEPSKPPVLTLVKKE